MKIDDIKSLIDELSLEDVKDLESYVLRKKKDLQNAELRSKLIKKLKVIKDFINCTVSYGFYEKNDLDDEIASVDVIFTQGRETIVLKSLNNSEDIYIRTSFGNLEDRHHSTVTALPYRGWTLHDSYHLLRVVNEVCMLNHKDSVTEIIREHEPRIAFTTDTEHDKEQLSSAAFVACAPLILSEGFDDLGLTYTINNLFEEAEVEIYKDQERIAIIIFDYDRKYSMFPNVAVTGHDDIADTESLDNIDKEFICKLVEQAMPIHGKECARVLRIQDEQAKQ